MYMLRRITAVTFLALMLAGPVAAQTIEVQNGGTVQIQNAGVWDLEGGTMDFGPTGSTATLDEQSEGRATNGTLTAIRALNDPTSADPAGLGLEITASPDLGDVTVTRGHTPQTGGGNSSIERYYDVSPSQNNSGLNAELLFTYNDAENPSLSELVFFKSTDGGANWSNEGFDTRSSITNEVGLDGIDSFSRWTLASDSGPLPVELTAFDAIQTGTEAVRLQWETASEKNNVGFRVERAIKDEDGTTSDWTEVGSVEGAGTTDKPQSYQFRDEDLPYEGNRITYRLRQVDADGTTTLSDPVKIARATADEPQLLGAYPNPARNQATVRYALPEAVDDATLRIYDGIGRQVRSVSLETSAGRHKHQLSTEALASGMYFLRLRVNGTVKTQRLTVVQ